MRFVGDQHELLLLLLVVVVLMLMMREVLSTVIGFCLC